MSVQSNEILKESILMNIMGMEEEDLIEELGGKEHCENYGWTDYDCLLDALVEKRFDEDPRQLW